MTSTEEDTFRLLKRIPFEEMDALYTEVFSSGKWVSYVGGLDTLTDKIFRENSWTRNEYHNESLRRLECQLKKIPF